MTEDLTSLNIILVDYYPDQNRCCVTVFRNAHRWDFEGWDPHADRPSGSHWIVPGTLKREHFE